MSSVYSKFASLKNAIPGNREKFDFEYSFGATRHELQHITPPSAVNERIISEIEFALSLSSYEDGKYDDLIEKAIDYLLACVERDGVLTNSSCEQAEQMLASLEAVAKEWRIILVAHAHIDMNWMWGWQETVAVALSTFRTILNIMDEYPEFVFSQSQASCYKIVEEFDPDMMEQIKERIAQGRWETTATAWVETDKNMPCTESLLQHIQQTKRYMREVWNVKEESLQIDFSPDTFGHSAHIPEINTYGNVKYYYHCRGLGDQHTLYRWRSPSGKEVLVHREYDWYNASITPHIAMSLTKLAKRNAGLKTGLMVYGVGNHGGGPTRRDVEKAIAMKGWKIYPQIEFGSLRQYFEEAEKVRENLPVVDKELNYFATGCYTTQSRIKMGNRAGERSLITAETFSAFHKMLFGSKLRGRSMNTAWQNLLFTHFHDILTGSCVQETREHAMGLYADVTATAQTYTTNALKVICENIDTSFLPHEDISSSQSEGAGAGYGLDSYTGIPNVEKGAGISRVFHIFNSQPCLRKEVVEITLWDWYGDMRYAEFVDSNQRVLKHKFVSGTPQKYWDHMFLTVYVEVEVPSMGYTTVVLRETPRSEYIHYINDKPGSRERTEYINKYIVLENENIIAEFYYGDGQLISLIDKSSGVEMLSTDNKPDLYLVDTEARSSDAWRIGKYKKINEISEVMDVNVFSDDGIISGFEVHRKVLNSTIRQIVSLKGQDKFIRYNLEVEWNEHGTTENVPVLVFRCPHGYEAQEYIYSVPAGVIARKELDNDVPSTLFATAINPKGNSLMLTTDCKYGYRAYNQTLSVTLINTATAPDKFPERGIHKINIYLGVVNNDVKVMHSVANNAVNPPIVMSGNRHNGNLPVSDSFLKMSDSSVELSTVTLSGDENLLVRYSNPLGEIQKFKLSLTKDVEKALYVDLDENILGDATVCDNIVEAVCKPFSIGAIKIIFK